MLKYISLITKENDLSFSSAPYLFHAKTRSRKVDINFCATECFLSRIKEQPSVSLRVFATLRDKKFIL